MKKQSNEEWIAKLKGERGIEQQLQAFEELGTLLHRAVFNYLLNHQPGLTRLASFSHEELAEMAHDFVQEALEKISTDNFRRLDQFKGSGSFEGWAIRIACRQAGQELRRKYWHITIASPDETEQIETSQAYATPKEEMAVGVIRDETVAEVGPKIELCISRLAERQKVVFWGVVVQERNGQEIAEELQITPNAVYILLCRAKQALRKCLAAAGVGPDILDVYEDAPKP